MEEKKQKFALWIYPSTLKQVNSLFQEDNCKSRSDFIEKAILFYIATLLAPSTHQYYSDSIISTVKGTVDNFENRVSSILFKNAVELSMLNNIIAANFGIDDYTLSKLRDKCITEVRRLHGNIPFEDAIAYQNGDKNE